VTRTFRYQEIAESLRTAISDGEYDGDGVLPSESELSATHQASRVTIRKALEHLRQDGLVDSRQGFGWILGADPLRQSLDAFETIEAQLAAAGRTSERRVLAFGFADAPADVAPLLGSEVLEVVRLNLADGEPFAHVAVWCDSSLGADLSRRDVEQSTFVDLLGDRFGSARQVISATMAEGQVADRLEVEAGAALLRVRRVTANRAGDSVLVSEQLFPAHQTEFEVTLPRVADASVGLRLVAD